MLVLYKKIEIFDLILITGLFVTCILLPCVASDVSLYVRFEDDGYNFESFEI